MADRSAAAPSSGVGVGLGAPLVSSLGVCVGDGVALTEGVGRGLSAFFTRERIFAKSGLPGWTTLLVSGRERIESPFWMRRTRSTQAGSSDAGTSMLTLFLTTLASSG